MSDHRHRMRPDAKTLRHRRLAGVAMLVALVALVAAVVSFVDGGPKSSRSASETTRHHAVHRSTGTSVTTDGTFTGPDGVEANWVIAENKKPGTTAWKITTPQTAGGIMGYADTQQATVGQKVALYVSTQAPSFRVEAFRMGYYQGKGGRLVWTSKTVPGVVQPACPVIPTVFEVQCTWPASLTFTVTSAWVQGDYLLKLVGSGGQQSYVPLTIWDPSSHAAYVVMNAVATWQVFNPFGGYDLYEGGPPGLKGYPPPDRSRIVSFDRPYAYGNGAASFLTNELPLIEFMEKHGLDVTYWTDVTLATNGSQLVDHKALLSLGHDEEWSLRMRDNATAARDKGVNLMFFGASPVLRKIRFEASPIGPNMEVVNYRDPQADPLYGKDNAEVTQNWWGQPPANDPASTLVGATYIGFNNTTPANMDVVDASSWVFKGTGLTNGSQIPGVLFTDFDGYDTSRPNPPDVQILTHSPVTIGFSGTKMYADTTYYTWPASGAGVFESGTNYWIAAMTPCPPGTASCAAPALDTITGNLLAAFGSGPAGIAHPSVTNWQQFYPPGG
ncbi:MAG: hypothetical protein M0Z93_11335 [Actinomycetota bacterium]|jgi:hypothetical protein|nr:hypothetical protein [Actinomycetota bacterium]